MSLAESGVLIVGEGFLFCVVVVLSDILLGESDKRVLSDRRNSAWTSSSWVL